MGGNALSVASVRLTHRNYHRIAEECVAKLKTVFPDNRISAIQAYAEKSDFGDLDILIENQNFNPLIAAAALNAVEVVRNGPVTSIGILIRPDIPATAGNIFQVDFVTISPQAYDYAKSYFAYCDQGNLVGRLYHAMGLTHRHDGLYYYYRDGNYKFQEILLTQDYLLALKFMQYNTSTFSKGFNTLTDLFEFVVSSPLFCYDLFPLENRNATARTRDRKRPTYNQFLKWCNVQTDIKSYQYPDDKSVWLPVISQYFPHFSQEYQLSENQLARIRLVKTKFNGKIASEITGQQGQQLGVILKKFNESFLTLDEMQEFVLQSSMGLLTQRLLLIANS